MPTDPVTVAPERLPGARRIYIASSWRNDHQPGVVTALREAGHEVYDFRNPAPGNTGFAWSAIDREWLGWDPAVFAELVHNHPVAQAGFAHDKTALDWCDTCVLVLPCGRSAHLEAGYAAGQGKRVFFLLHPDRFKPELMYELGNGYACSLDELLPKLAGPALTAPAPAAAVAPFQARVKPWLDACFGPTIAADRVELNHRFLEEALELVQSTGCMRSEAHHLVDYVYNREPGVPQQEAGGVMVTLAALCLAHGFDMHEAGETELARIWTKVEKIRAKQAAKPKHSPLPEAAAAVARPSLEEVTRLVERLEALAWGIGSATERGSSDDRRQMDREANSARTALLDAIAALSAPAAQQPASTATDDPAYHCPRCGLDDSGIKHVQAMIDATPSTPAAQHPAPVKTTCIKSALDACAEFLVKEYRDDSEAPGGEWMSPIARPVYSAVCDALDTLTQHPAPVAGDLAEALERIRPLSEAACSGDVVAMPFPHDDGSEGPDWFIQAGSGNLAGDFEEPDARFVAASWNFTRDFLAGRFITAGRAVAEGWQPIATAPSNGTSVWVFGGFYPKPCVVEADGSWWRSIPEDGPTHWMPIIVPAPPTPTAGDKS